MLLKTVPGTLAFEEIPDLCPGPGQVLIRVEACGVCRTDVHLVDGELPEPKLPVIPGHQVVGRVVGRGPGVETPPQGKRVGVPWLAWTCGQCEFCRTGRENLCDAAQFTGYTVDGGFAEFVVADARFVFPLPEDVPAESLAPLLCAGLIGYRALVKAGTPRTLGIFGFGSAAHILTQLATQMGKRVFAFTRPGDSTAQQFALELGACWAGGSDSMPPEPLDAAIIFAPVGELVPRALQAIKKGGIVVCGGIHMSDIPTFPYRLLWGERSVVSVANLTRKDGLEFFGLLERVRVRTRVEIFPLQRANDALGAIRSGALTGSVVLKVT